MPQALKHIDVHSLEQFLESGDDCGIFELLEKAIVEAKKSPDGTATVQFFVDYEPDEEDEEED